VTRLGVYIDALYRREGDQLLTGTESIPFLRFATEVGTHFDALVLFGRDAPTGLGVDHPLPPGTGFAPLPYYPSLADFGQFAGAVARTVKGLWRGLDDVDVVWAFGPHPFSLLLALMARARGKRAVLGVRQDTVRYFRSRLRSPKTKPLLGPLWLLDRVWKLLGRLVPVAVVGDELAKQYGAPRPGVHAMTVSLVRAADLAPTTRDAELSRPIELLTVGRVEPEKNPLLLVDALADLGPGFRLTWVGTGRMSDAVAERAAERGADVELTGFIAPGPGLLDRYRAADAFVHVALTEGVPQVLLEAMSTATPIVATAVGGVATALEGGAAGLLVPPDDRAALVRAITALVDDPAARDTRARHGLELAAARTLEAEAGRVAAWMPKVPRA
jgi:glycosyltransferase involved in cell wall biosynthesis